MPVSTKTWLVFDISYLAHRAESTTGSLSLDGIPTGVLFGVLRDILGYRGMFDTPQLAFCFDSASSLRRQRFPFYKSSRNSSPDTSLACQVSSLQFDILPKLGYKNIFSWEGYEADDIIACVTHNVASSPSDKAVIISEDKDLYQLLKTDRVWMWKPRAKRAYTEENLKSDFNVTPAQWPIVKAIAGCPTDEIPGVKGVGELTASRFITSQLKEKSKAFKAIEYAVPLWARNRILVDLPYEGCPPCFLRSDDGISKESWRKVLNALRMKSLIRQFRLED